MDETILKDLFEKSQSANSDKLQFSEDESTKFQKAFEDPEFRKLFSDYIDELQDPKNREENEAYITQLEGEKKVPEGKELIRPEPVFVAKTHKVIKNNDKGKNEKLFINVVQSTKIAVPSKTTSPEGNCWSVPYSLGPPHMEKDKEGVNAPCFDCCFHPEALQLGRSHKEFRDLLVHTAMDGVEQMYLTSQNQTVVLSRQFHVVKGLSYKQGQVPTMMIPLADKDKWKQQPDTSSSTSDNGPSTGSRALSVTATSSSSDGSADGEKKTVKAKVVVSSSSSSLSSGPAIKRGFLNSSSGSSKAGARTPEQHTKTGLTSVSKVLLKVSDSTEEVRSPLLSAQTTGSGPQRLIQEVVPRTVVPVSTSSSNSRPTSTAGVELMKPVSTVKRVPPAPHQTTPIATLSPRDTPPPPCLVDMAPSGGDGAVCPKYSVRERGSVGMGDFEAMRSSQASSNRPDELVYRIELPLATKASLVVLDVASKHLSLSYLDVYRLSLPLPYAVHDSRGSAKYDKATRSLTVTLPVVQATVKTARSIVDSNEPGKGEEMALEITASPSPEIKGNSAEGTHAAAISNKSHSRWVSTVTDIPVPVEGTVGLLEEVRAKAEKALEEAAASICREGQTRSVDVKDTLKLASEQQSCLSSPFQFQASIQFVGHRAGCVFRNGDEGVGYYSDPQQDPPMRTIKSWTAVAPSSSKCTVSVAAPRSFTVTSQQTRSALAVLVGVARIVPDSVLILFRQYAVDISFRAFCCRPDEETQFEEVEHGMRLTLLPERCPGGLDAQKCHHDVATGNMALVLTKSGDGSLWLEETDDGCLPSATSLFRLDPLDRSIPDEAASSSEPISDSASICGNGKFVVNDLLTAMSKMQFSTTENMMFDLD